DIQSIDEAVRMNEIKQEPTEIKDEPIDEFADLKKEEVIDDALHDISYEIKDEQMNVKEEPLDVKEELPIFDLYCPSNDTSRALNQPTPQLSETKNSINTCSECGKILSHKWSLDYHMRTHSERKLPSCSI
ncbi:hypothetical protein PMAYCL1PPCAC_20821, partial [Pristionchus mayeri]